MTEYERMLRRIPREELRKEIYVGRLYRMEWEETEAVDLRNLLPPDAEVWLLSSCYRPKSTAAGVISDSVIRTPQVIISVIRCFEGCGQFFDPALPLRLTPLKGTLGKRAEVGLLLYLGGENSLATAWIYVDTDLVNMHLVFENADISTPVGTGFYQFRNSVQDNNLFDECTSTAGAEEEVLRVDLGSVLDIERLAFRFNAFIDVATAGSFAKVYYSEDAVTWVEMYGTGDLLTTAESKDLWTYHPYKDDVKVRYVRWTLNSADPARTATLRLFTGFAWVKP